MEITYFLPSQDPAAKTVAEFGVKCPELDMTFSRIKLIRGKNGSLFIAAPSFKQGEEFRPYWILGESRKKWFNDLAMQELKDFYQKQYDKSFDTLISSSQEEIPF